jgi:hypothetical protein
MKTTLLILLLCLPMVSKAQTDTLTAYQAHAHVGKTVWVQMYVAEFRNGINESPSYLNIAEKYPKNPLRIVIFDHQVFKEKTGYNPAELVGKTIFCLAKITSYNSKTQISQNDIKQLSFR